MIALQTHDNLFDFKAFHPRVSMHTVQVHEHAYTRLHESCSYPHH